MTHEWEWIHLVDEEASYISIFFLFRIKIFSSKIQKDLFHSLHIFIVPLSLRPTSSRMKYDKN